MTDSNNSEYIFKAYVVNMQAYDAGERDVGAWLHFPAKEEDVQALLDEIGLPPDAMPDRYFMDDYVCNIEGMRPLLPMYGDIDDFAALAQKIHNLPPHERDKLDAVQSSPLRFTDLEQFHSYPWNTDCFTLDADIKDDAALGWSWLYQQGLTEIPESCKDAIDPVPFGRHVREMEQGFFTDKGYIMCSGDEWQYVQPSKKPEHEEKPSLKAKLEQSKKECAAREPKPDKPVKSGPEL
ncbi:antirestriction protein ArdA [Oscillospiraceae bacterium OttesenSCG-928-G22]|nr:antirestriction protein ArdA [Eubacteriales bacterium OttesenSCG-928-K08]MDL2273695.1 antirestriction protein ArdA [Oscillospiraceae bacterium OttesenSCG-928-G22]MDL2288598.1 antirestriction protein ArdA [Oscillospiraceae bacterium OttesenSCG-928-F05]MDL2300073.1 antirestriction protein ArdA [Clostridiaceae bacterium OttesenSCG-928-D20]